MEKINIAIIGSRTFNDYNFAKQEINNILNSKYIIENIISGGAKGADKIGELYAIEYSIPIEIIKPDWSIGRHAGILRNTEIIKKSNIVIAFWDGKSKGTKDSINKAKKQGKILHIIEIN